MDRYGVNLANPDGSTGAPYSASLVYLQGDIVFVGAQPYLSLADNNQGNAPASSAAFWRAIGGASALATASAPGAVQLATGQTNATLATVATTGSYADLTGKPTGGGSSTPATASAPGTVQLAAGQSSYILAPVASSGSYSDLSNRPALATVATSGVYSDLSGRPALATVATSGSYNDLIDKPASTGGGSSTAVNPATATAPGTVQLAAGQSSYILATVASSGSYNDLTAKPTIPTAVTLETNGVANGSQSVLNLAAGANITLSSSGGTTTITAAGSTGGGGGSVSPATSSSLGTVQLASGQTSTTLAKVATTGVYTDLSGVPTQITSATATQLPAGSQPTATISNGNIALGIPAGAQGTTSVQAGIFGYAASFAGPGTLTIQHNLGVIYPLLVVYSNSGNRRWQFTPIDQNSGTFSTDVAGSFQVQFLNATATSTTTGGSGSGGSTGGSIAIPTSGLVEYWPMTEGTGTSCGNSVVTANPLTLSGYAWTPESGYQSSAACVFNGSTGGGLAAQVDSASNFDGSSPFTISAWFTPADTTTNKMVASNGRICLLLSNEELQFFLWGGGSWGNGSSIQQHFSTDAQNSFPANALTHLVLTYDGSGKAAGLAIYIKGALFTTNNYGPDQDSYSNTGACTTAWCVGNYPGANPNLPMNGIEAGVAIYNRVLTASEVSQIYSLGAP